MTKFFSATRVRTRGRKASALLGVLGLFLMSGGLSLVAQGAANAAPGGHIPVAVCHADSGQGGPTHDGYKLIYPDASSVQLQGHLMHRNSPNKHWDSGALGGSSGWWNGTLYHVGDLKPDLVASYTDAQGHFHALDGTNAEVAAACGAPVLKPAAANVVFHGPSCDPVTAANFTVGSPSDHVTYVLTNVENGTGANAGKVRITVTATADPGYGLPPSGGSTETFTSDWYTVPTCGGEIPPPTHVTPVITITQGVCNSDGNVTDGSFSTPASQTGVTYSPQSNTTEGPGASILVTATADSSHVLDATLGWVVTGSGAGNSATYSYTFPNGTQLGCHTKSNAKPVPTVAPAFDGPACPAANAVSINLAGDGFMTPAELTAAGGKDDTGTITYTVTGSFAPGGTVHVSAAADPSWTLADGSVSAWTHTFGVVNCQTTIPGVIHSGMGSVGMTPFGSNPAVRAWGYGLTGAGAAVFMTALVLGRRRQSVS